MEDVRLSVVNTPVGWTAVCSEFIHAVASEFRVFRVHRQTNEYGPKMVVWLVVCCDLMIRGEQEARITFEQHRDLEYTAQLCLPVQVWKTFAKGQVAFFRELEASLAFRLADKDDDTVRILFAYPSQDRYGNGKGIHSAFFVQMLLFGKRYETVTGPTLRDFVDSDEPMVTRTDGLPVAKMPVTRPKFSDY
jgi:hypothetical protein